MAPSTTVAARIPCPDEAEPARAGEGSTALIAIAATVAITAPRPIDENTPLRANVFEYRPWWLASGASFPTNQRDLLRFRKPLRRVKDHGTVAPRFAHRLFRFEASQLAQTLEHGGHTWAALEQYPWA